MDFLKVTDTGINVASRQEIYRSLADFARQAYGNDIILDEGTSFDNFLQLLADSLSSVNGSVLSLTELFSVKGATGNFLDFIAGGRGVIRKTLKNQRVIMTVIVDEHIGKPFLARIGTLFVRDSSSGSERVWVNTEQLIIQERKFLPSGAFGTTENFQGTCEFGLLDLSGNDPNLLLAGTYSKNAPMEMDERTDVSIREHLKIFNSVNASPPVTTTENDAQLRARYERAVYSKAVSAVDGLQSALLEIPNLQFVRIVENLTNIVDANGLAPHSIWCIVGGGSTARNWKPYILVTESLADAIAFDSAEIVIGDFIRVGALGINIMGSTERPLDSVWERTGESELTARGEDYLVSTDQMDVAVAQTILNYKSLGCGVSVSGAVTPGTVDIGGSTLKTGNFMVEIPLETMVAEIPFTRLVNNVVSFTIVLTTTVVDSVLRDLVRGNVSLALQEYVSELQPGEVITLADTVNAVQGVLVKYDKGRFDFVSSAPGYSVPGGIKLYQKAVGGIATVSFVGE